jgi:thiol-disulfide isomerase/thioredoxin
MSEDPRASGKRGLGPLTWALWVAALIGVAALLYIMLQSSTKPAPVVATGPVARAPLKPLSEKLTRPAQPTPPPDYVFYNDAGKPVRIADFKGKVVFLNLWATWCGPCKIEMPTIAKAAAAYKGKPVEFVTLSIDKPEAAVQAKLFISRQEPLRFYSDPEAKIIFQFSPPAEGMPTTVIYGKDGLEKARISGEADWSSPEARALIDEALAG